MSPRLFLETSPSAKTSKGFLIDGTRVASSRRQFKKHDFQDATLGSIVGIKPLLPKRLRKFKNFHCQLRHFVVRTIQHVELQLDSSDPIPQFGLLGGKRLVVDLIAQPQIEQPILLPDEQAFLPQ